MIRGLVDRGRAAGWVSHTSRSLSVPSGAQSRLVRGARISVDQLAEDPSVSHVGGDRVPRVIVARVVAGQEIVVVGVRCGTPLVVYPLFHLIAYRGTRRGETCGARSVDLNKAASSLKVSEQLVQLGWKVEAGKPKSEAGDRTIGLDDLTNNVLEAASRSAARRRNTRPRGGGRRQKSSKNCWVTPPASSRATPTPACLRGWPKRPPRRPQRWCLEGPADGRTGRKFLPSFSRRP
jgi:hypothetical protein